MGCMGCMGCMDRRLQRGPQGRKALLRQAHCDMVIDAPIDCRDQDVVARLGGLGNQRLDLAKPCGFAAKLAGQIDHDQELAAALIER